MSTLFDRPPAQAHSPTSVAAAEQIRPSAETLRAMVLRELRGSPDGLTDEELQDRLGMGGSTQRPRRCELVERGLVFASGRTRPTKSGRSAAVWVATKYVTERPMTTVVVPALPADNDRATEPLARAPAVIDPATEPEITVSILDWFAANTVIVPEAGRKVGR